MDKDKSALRGGVVEKRVKSGVKGLKAYSVPHIECRVKLDGNESPFSPPPDVKEKLAERLNAVEVNRYPDPEAAALREKIARASGVPTDSVLLGNGSDELIGILVAACTGSSGKVLYPTPTFSMYGITSIALGAEVLEVPLDDKFDIELESTLKLIESEDPDLIFLASPNNPTGNAYSEDRIKTIIERAGGIVVVDEAYSDFSGYTFMPMLKENENLVIMRTLSKVGFAGLRLGMLYADPGLVSELNKVRYPYNINSLSQATAEVVLESHEFVTENIQLIIRERERVFSELMGLSGIELSPSDANFIFFKARDSDGLFKKLVDRDVLIRNFNKPGRLESCMRVTIGTPDENNAFVEALRDALSS